MSMRRSYNDEERIISKMFTEHLPLRHEFCVDIGAGDGVTMSNSHFLFAGGWKGLAVEYSAASFATLAQVYGQNEGVQLARCRATPEGIEPLFRAFGVPKDFDFLSLDIDGYDHFVLEAVFSAYRPTLVCTEINETFAPPVKFVVKYHPEFRWKVDRFFGHSIAKVGELCDRHGYAIVGVEYNNAFLAPRELLEGAKLRALTPEEGYREGYLERADRLERFPWNGEVERLRSMSPEEVVEWARGQFSKYEGQYEISAG